MQVRERVSGCQTKWPYMYFFFFFFFFFFCKDAAQTLRMHILIPIWNFVGDMYSWMSSDISCKPYNSVKTQRP